MKRPDWMDDALCAQVDTDLFFPDRGQPAKPAKKVCARCGVAAQCLAYALRMDMRFGVWGGKSERERARMEKPPVEETWHGSPAGYARHYRRGEKACQKCRQARLEARWNG